MAAPQRERAEILKEFVGSDYKVPADFDHAAAEKCVMPLNAVTPFAGNGWLVKARVVEKQPVRRWRNAKGEGLVTSITVIDGNGTTMRINLFQEGVNKYWRMLQLQKVFYFGPSKKAGQSVRVANKQFSSLQHDYELALDETSTIHPVQATHIGSIATSTSANFLRLSELIHRQAGSSTDIRAVVVAVGPITDVVQKTTGQQLKRRVVQLCDNSGQAGTICDLTLFEDAAKAVPQTAKAGMVITARGLRVKHYLTTASLTAPRDPDSIKWDADGCEYLTKWWDESGKANVVKGYVCNVSRIQETGEVKDIKGGFRLGLDAIEQQGLGLGEKPDYINVRGMVMGFPEKEERQQFYDACPCMVDDERGEKRQCGKKIENFIAGSKSHCQKCDTDIDHVVQRWIAGIRIADHTKERWTTLFDDVGSEFFGCPASAIKRQPDSMDQLKKQLNGAHVTMTLRCKERLTPDGNPRMEAQCVRVRRLHTARDWTIDCRNMLTDLERYHNGDASQVQVP